MMSLSRMAAHIKLPFASMPVANWPVGQLWPLRAKSFPL